MKKRSYLSPGSARKLLKLSIKAMRLAEQIVGGLEKAQAPKRKYNKRAEGVMEQAAEVAGITEEPLTEAEQQAVREAIGEAPTAA